MSHPSFEFIVSDFVDTDTDRLRVIGRCGDETIKVGDEFNVIYRYRRSRTLEDYANEPIRESETRASLRVVDIYSLSRSLQVLGQGMTGSLTVEGGGIEDIGPGCVLGHQDVSTHVPGAPVVGKNGSHEEIRNL